MKVLFQNIFAIIVCMNFFCVTRVMADPINDLSSADSVVTSADVYVVSGVGGYSRALVVDIAASSWYSSSIICNIIVDLPIAQSSTNQVTRIIKKDVMVFPSGAFRERIVTRLNDSIGQSVLEQLPLGRLMDARSQVYCSGVPADYRLPVSLCSKLDTKYMNHCEHVRRAGLHSFPLTQNDFFLGTCPCQ